ncbi:phosphate ABC transporter permease subunit PstC [Lederbergia panacisoli]|uniref:phosphate ABC transporter permease subunit PstC n=1 Tax=Lederbergia panacisoli TaxID=1255251 RepID=UPI00214BE6A4|nr:phosphate ABC transporter permease subunit PstC [Lederbergia panacisoli]MCR2822423.1 phosphate ABC transporter permease subunit PstC [Lederbergia panacisoli]
MDIRDQKISVAKIIEENKRKDKVKQALTEKSIPVLLFLMAIISIMTTIGIVMTLLVETITFFKRVNFIDFISGTEWFPFFEADPQYGIIPLISGTLLVAIIAMLVAIPIGLATAIYLSEFASERVRKIVKPILEVLAGIPTIVYGFFALTFVTPSLQKLVPDLNFFNALSPGIVVGIMIIPMVASLSEDAMSAVPRSMREGALALGSTKLEVSLKVVLPAALSGIIASFVLGISRAIGETMIVTIAGGSKPNLTFDPTETIQTMTAYIVQVSLGDASYGSTIYYSIYAVGMALFVFTLIMNIIAQWISKRYREEY